MKFCFYGSIAKGLQGEPIGGGEQQLALIAKYLNELGHDVVIIDSDAVENKNINGIEILFLNSNNKILRLFKLYKILVSVNADVYYARVRSSIHLLALLASKINKSKFVYHLASDLDSENFKKRWIGFYSKLPSISKKIKHLIHGELLFNSVLRYSDLIITQNSQQTTNLISRKYKNVNEVNNLFQFENYINSDLSISDYFLFVGSLDLRKGINELKYIINKNKDLFFIIIGKARDKNGIRFIKDVEKYTNVKVLGNLPHEKVMEYMKGAKGLINTSINEGFSNAFIEAWSCGVPVFSLNSNPSNIFDNVYLGQYYNSDISKMASDLNKLINNYDKNKIIEYVKKNHDPIKNVNLIIDKVKNLF